jgi:acetyl-CoA synthetase
VTGERSSTESRYNVGVACSDAPAARFPDEPALTHESAGATNSISFAELARRSTVVAAGLAGLGIGPGARVGVYASAGIDTAIAHLGVLKAGAATVPLIPLLGDEAIAFRLTEADISCMLVSPREHDRSARLAAQTGSVRHVLTFPEIEQAGRAESACPVVTRASDPAIVIFSSGTTGKPKGVVLPHAVVLGRQSPMSMIHGPFRPGDVFWTPVDWLWIGSFVDSVLSPLSFGGGVFTYDRERFEPVDAVRRLREYGVTKAFVAPTALRMLMAVPAEEWVGHRLSSVHTGGEALTSAAAQWANDVLGLAVDEIYGMTEASFLVGNAHRYYPIVPGSMGLPYPGQTIALRTLDGETPRPGETGEIVIDPSCPTLFLGYHGNPRATAERFVDRWYTTGDLATCDERGYLFYVGRKDDLIISAGHRIGPGEIEEAIRRDSRVREVAVVGVPDETRGQRIKAFVQLHEGREPTQELTELLQDLVRRVVGRHAYPREIEYLTELPRTPTGKVQRHVLRARST